MWQVRSFHCVPSNSCSLVAKYSGEVHPATGHEGRKGEYMYRSTLSLTSGLDGVGG